MTHNPFPNALTLGEGPHMLSIEIAIAGYKLLGVSVEELHHIYIAEVMGMRRIYITIKNILLSFAMHKSF
jgi:hypothetical protein